MDAKLFYGRGFGVPVGGAVVDVDAADASTVINATSGLVKELFKVGEGIAVGACLGMGLLAVFSALSAGKNEEEPNIPIATIARISTFGISKGWSNRDFNGILMDDNVEILADGNKLQIQGEYITRIENLSNSRYCPLYHMSLADGSIYSNFSFEKKKYNFASISGLQTVKMSDVKCIKGHTPTDLSRLKTDLTFALNHNLDEIIKSIGKDTFDKFFVLK